MISSRTKILKYEIGETVKVLNVGHMFSSDPQIAIKLDATRWRIRAPFNRRLEGENVIIVSREDVEYPRYLIEFNDGEQYIISGTGLTKASSILPNDLFEI